MRTGKRAFVSIGVLGWLWGCVPSTTAYEAQVGGNKRTLEPVRAKVVSLQEAQAAQAAGMIAVPQVVPFTGQRDGTQLVEEMLQRADAARAPLVAELAIYLVSAQGEQVTECRSAIVPESVTETRTVPGSFQMVPVSRPVTRMVTDYEHRCHSVTRHQMRSYTDYQTRCRPVMRTVTRYRTDYSTQYDHGSRSSRTVSRQVPYTATESHTECNREPVQRTRMEPVTSHECRMEPVTRSVTRYEFQLENQYVPPRYESIERQRLRELAPECFAVPPGAEPGRHVNRIEASFYSPPPKAARRDSAAKRR